MSMYSPDIKPNRLTRARFKLRDLLQQPYEGQTGLVAFAGDAFVVTPLTRDVDTIEAMLEALDPSIMPTQGSRLDQGLRKAVQLLRQARLPHGHIIAVTDGNDADQTDAIATEAFGDGYSVSILAVGTPEGAPLPNGNGGVIKNIHGDVVLPRLNEAALRHIVNAGGGVYARMAPDNRDLDRLARVETQVAEQTQAEDMFSDQWKETGPWLTLLLLPIAALAFRKGWLLSFCLPFVFLAPVDGQAAGITDWFLNAEQRAQRALDRGDFEAAQTLSSDESRRGAALYRAGDYDGAAAAYATAESADAHYNRGNALVQQGKYDEAIAAYDSALAKQPDMADAIANRALAESLKNQPQENQESESENQKGQESEQQQADEQNEGDSNDSETSSASDSASSNPDDNDERASENEAPESSEQNEAESSQEERDAADESLENNPQNPQSGDQTAASEEEVATEQWLRRVEDDPGELLRRKFLYQYQQRDKQAGSRGQQPW